MSVVAPVWWPEFGVAAVKQVRGSLFTPELELKLESKFESESESKSGFIWGARFGGAACAAHENSSHTYTAVIHDHSHQFMLFLGYLTATTTSDKTSLEAAILFCPLATPLSRSSALSWPLEKSDWLSLGLEQKVGTLRELGCAKLN